jgi:hypothetical protein
MQHFQFNQRDDSGAVTKNTVLHEDAKWPAVVGKFAEFLSAVYGYDIKEKIVVFVGNEYVPLKQQILDDAINEAF